LILSGVLGSIVMAGNAEACHKLKCACATPAPVPCTVAYVQPARCYKPAPCVKTVVVTTSCAPRVKHCKFTLPKLFHHKNVVTCATPVPCATPVYYAQAAPVSYPLSSPQSSAQH
jgi:hypothetical protein